jgi:hypothetical protein
MPNEKSERQGDADPDSAPDRRFAKLDFMRSAVEDTQVQGKSDQDKKIKPDPQEKGAHAKRIA